MIVTCSRDGLLNACQIAGVAIPARTTMPIYQNIKAIASKDQLTVMATDLEVGIRYEVRGIAVEEPGEAILPVGRVISILRESMDSEVRLDADERRARVNTSVSEYEMPGEDPTTFSDIADFVPGERYTELAAGDLQRMIRRTIFAAAKDEGKVRNAGGPLGLRRQESEARRDRWQATGGFVGAVRFARRGGEEGALAFGAPQGDDPARTHPG